MNIITEDKLWQEIFFLKDEIQKKYKQILQLRGRFDSSTKMREEYFFSKKEDMKKLAWKRYKK